ncbi:MAG TPA: MoxR family ATPase, partial [Ktedonobacteraceae bacterium]|nr:MoxR family ATPase [Ktedonobacteraceae bacterium]
MQQEQSITLETIEDVQRAMFAQDYIADRSLATAVFLALKRHKPLLLEGEPGVGKTEVAKVLAALLGTRLIRLQCYEGIDINTAVYEWNYTRQMLHIRMLEAGGTDHQEELKEIFGRDFLIERPLLQAIDPRNSKAPVLLIDELDRSDEEFEAYLLELLSDFQITIPEIGTIRAQEPPFVIITSNRTREIHDALRRRCLYYWIDFPTLEKEYSIVMARMPGVPERLARQVCTFVRELRSVDLYKAPGVAETLDWIGS